MLKVINYIKNTSKFGITIKQFTYNDNIHLGLRVYTDSDWDVDPDNRRNVSVWIVLSKITPSVGD